MEHYDVVVVGGGPGGSSAATFVAMQGHRVLLLEKETFPVHKIGESLLPATVNGICAMLGVTEQLARAGFVRKYGGTFRWGRQAEPWTLEFSRSPNMSEPTSFAYQVERMKFDTILLDNARAKGVDVRECHNVKRLLADPARVHGVVFVDAEGRERHVSSRFVVDASGWSTTLHRHVGERVFSQSFRNVAVFGYYTDGKRLPSPCAGNIFSCAFDLGWFWYIPLSDRLTSVGAVIGQEHAHILNCGLEEALTTLIARCQPVREMLIDATRVTSGPYGKVRVRKDYSYCNAKFWSPGIALVGDAACFIDPVFSSGVHLATYSGLLAARSINSCFAEEMSEERAFSEFSRRYLREYRYFYDFLMAFYNIHQDVESYYWEARRILNSALPANEAFIDLVAGIGGTHEPLFGSTDAFLQSQADLADQLFRDVENAKPYAAIEIGGTSLARRFVSGLVKDQAYLQAALRKHRGLEQPLFHDGLVPSADGLHWVEPPMAVRRAIPTYETAS